jgi:DNA-directed RNA polymerase specialized sigma24 family protein
MSRDAAIANDGPIPAQPMQDGAQAFSEQVHGLPDGQQKDEARVARALQGMDDVVESIGASLYNMASMLVGEGEDSVRLVETAIATAELSAWDQTGRARQSGRRVLCAAALELLAQRNSASLAAPQALEPAATCIEDDDLDAAGVSREELETMMAGADRDRVRTWLASLSTEVRTVFVLRAVAGFTAPETAGLLAAHGGPRASGWTADSVRAFFRQGLCSLASQLLQATVSSH